MLSVSTAIWNEIAKTQKLNTAWARKAFSLGRQEMIDFHSKACKKLSAKNFNPDVILSFLEVMPLLLENVAISRHIEMKQDLNLRQALPEVCTINEAVILATMEYRLNQLQQKQLSNLLKGFLAAEKRPIDYSRLGYDFFRCYFGDKPDVTITELSKIFGIGGVRKWGRMFLAWVEMRNLPCVKRKGRVRVTPDLLAVWFERESNWRQSERDGY